MGHAIFHIARADFLERTRRYSFFITLAAVIYGAYLFVPPDGSRYITMQMEGHRGIYNSAWIGSLVAMLSALFLTLAGFYLVKNSIRRDRVTRVGEIIASTPVKTIGYMLGKLASNFAVLSAMVLVLIVATGAMQLARAEDTTINLWQLAAPFLFFTLPAMAVTAGLAVFFEATPGLRGGLGNVIYYFLYTATIPMEMFLKSDMYGMATIFPYMTKACQAAFPDYDAASRRMSMGFHFKEDGQVWNATTFEWEGVPWGLDFALERIPWLLLAVGLAVAAGLIFDRFDPARAGRRKKTDAATGSAAESAVVSNEPSHTIPHVELTPIKSRSPRLRFFGVVRAEWQLMVWKRSVWWKLAALGLAVVGAIVPVAIGHAYLLPLSWIWPILLWSAMGTREKRHGTEGIVFSSPHTLGRQFVAAWIAGVALTAFAGGGLLIRFLIAGNAPTLQAWTVGIFFIPTLALACGAWTGTGKLFEVLYLIVWYVGPMNNFTGLDFIGTTPESLTGGTTETFLSATAVLLVLAFVGRWRQMRE